MILKFNDVEQEFDFERNNICQLILEDADMFFAKTNNLLKQLEGESQESVFSIKLLIFYNLPNYMSAEKITFVFKQCIYNEIKVLLINNVDNNLPSDKKIIIDNQLCEI